MTKYERWHYFDESSGLWSTEGVTLVQLDELAAQGRIDEHTSVISATMARRGGPANQGIPYSRVVRIPIEFSPTAEAFLGMRRAKLTTVLAGPNNSGKTLFLRQLRVELGHDAYLLQCNRFSQINVLNTRQVDQQEFRRYYDNFIQNHYTAEQNQESNELNLEQLITSLKETQLDRLFSLVSDLLGQKFSLQRVDQSSRFSPFYVDMDGQNLRSASTGTRLLFSLLGVLLDQRFRVVLIDEPEIGLSPRVQRAVAAFLFRSDTRADLFPHLKEVYIATHSHVFLDRSVTSNNHVVTRTGLRVVVDAVPSTSALNRLQFNLLGNDLEVLSLPSAIVVVEGESDQVFLAKVFEVRLPSKRISVVRAGGDGEILRKVHVIREALGDLATSPYRDRLFAVLDQENSANQTRLAAQGLRADHIRTWSRNGVEYLYPPAKLCSIFRCTEDELTRIDLEADPVTFNDVVRSKKVLAMELSSTLDGSDSLPQELDDFVRQVDAAVA